MLLIDEIDRADEAFEAYLLELLSDFQISIPELGTVRATSRPLVVITSNGTRELSDALRRRCLYQYIDYPDYDKELAIVRKKAPEAEAALAQQIVAFVQAVRRMELQKKPGIAETLDWTAALLRLGISTLDSRRRRAHHGHAERADQDARRPRGLPARGGGAAGGGMLSMGARPGSAGRRERLRRFPGFLHANGFGVGGGDAVQVLRAARARRACSIRTCCAGACRRCCAAAATNGGASTICSTPGSCLPTDGSVPSAREVADGAQSDAHPGGSREGERRRRRGSAPAPRGEPRGGACPRPTSARSTEREHALDIEALMRRLARQLKPIRLRREARARRGRRLDLPGTIRRSVASGGTPFHLAVARPRARCARGSCC